MEAFDTAADELPRILDQARSENLSMTAAFSDMAIAPNALGGDAANRAVPLASGINACSPAASSSAQLATIG